MVDEVDVHLCTEEELGLNPPNRGEFFPPDPKVSEEIRNNRANFQCTYSDLKLSGSWNDRRGQQLEITFQKCNQFTQQGSCASDA